MSSTPSATPPTMALNTTFNSSTLTTTRRPRIYITPIPITHDAYPVLGPRKEEYTEADMYILIVFNVLLGVLIIIGNVFVIVAIFRFRRLRRNITNHFVLSLAISDLLVGLALPLTFLSALFPEATFFKNYIHVCLLPFCLVMMLCCASMANLAAVAIDRFIAIRRPFEYWRLVSKDRAVGLICTCWTLALIIGAIPMLWNDGTLPNGKCLFREAFYDDYLLIVIFGVGIPLMVIIAVIYLMIYRVAHSHARRIEQTSIRSTRRPSLTKEKKAAMTILIVIGVFVVCWLPFFVYLSYEIFCNCKGDPVVRNVLAMLGFANSSVNPVIYAIRTQEYRSAFRVMLTRRTRREDRFLLRSSSSRQGTSGATQSFDRGAIAQANRRVTQDEALPSAKDMGTSAAIELQAHDKANRNGTFTQNTSNQILEQEEVDNVRQHAKVLGPSLLIKDDSFTVDTSLNTLSNQCPSVDVQEQNNNVTDKETVKETDKKETKNQLVRVSFFLQKS